jgi:hypothetical protein
MKTRCFLLFIASLFVLYYYFSMPKLSSASKLGLTRSPLVLDSFADGNINSKKSQFNAMKERLAGNINLSKFQEQVKQIPDYKMAIMAIKDDSITFLTSDISQEAFFGDRRTDRIKAIYRHGPIHLIYNGRNISGFRAKVSTEDSIQYIYLPYDILANVLKRVLEKDNKP